jgi:phosphoribosylformylglycinamidine synthase
MSMSGTYLAHIRVSFKPGVHDPESETIDRALNRLGFDQIASLRSGKFFDIHIEAKNPDQAEQTASKMCETLLANPVIETYSVEILG